MEKNQTLKEKKPNVLDTNLVLKTSSDSEVTLHETTNSFAAKNNRKIISRETFELNSIQNLIMIEANDAKLLEITQFIDKSYSNSFHISTFSNIVQALLDINQNTSIFIFDCHYFDQASAKIIGFVKNRNSTTLVISHFDTKKIASSIDGFTKKRKNNLIEENAIEINTSGLKQVVFPFHFSRWHYGTRKNYPYMILLLLIVAALFLINL